jgi:hypothetical protein
MVAGHKDLQRKIAQIERRLTPRVIDAKYIKN